MEPIRILQIFGEPFSNGGQESYILNMYQHMDRTRMQFDIFTPFTIRNEARRELFESLDGHIWAAGRPFNEDNNRYFREEVDTFLREHHYAIVHIHSGSTYALMIGSKLARRYGAKNVIVHSHCGGFVNLKYKVVRVLSRRALLKYPTTYYACSHLAARWKFPTPIIKKQRYTVLKNAVDTRLIHFDPTVREQYRSDMGLENQLVIGHVGRFAVQKNHRFLVEIFKELVQLRPDARLLLAGEGILEEEIRQLVHTYGLDEHVQFLGIRRDVAQLMNAFDVFLLPSFFEGLPVVGVEAQATGLPVVTSTGVTPELPLPDLAQYIPLDESPRAWAEQVIAAADQPRRNTTQEIIDCGYDVQVAAHYMQTRYEEMI